MQNTILLGTKATLIALLTLFSQGGVAPRPVVGLAAATQWSSRSVAPIQQRSQHTHSIDLASSQARGAIPRLTPELSRVHLDSGPSIDGASTPELIDDDTAYDLFLRMLLPRDVSTASQRAHRSYLSHVVRSAKAAGQEPTGVHPRAATNAEILALSRFVASYPSRLRVFDKQRIGLSGEGMQLIREIVESMPSHLGPQLAVDIDRYVRLQFKRKVKIIN